MDRTQANTSAATGFHNRQAKHAALGTPTDQIQNRDACKYDGGVQEDVETSIWDCEKPPDSFEESLSCYYEPQGELIPDQTHQRTANFHIPSALTSANDDPTVDLNHIIVPQRPEGSAPAVAGIKRKATALEDSVPSRTAASKRPTRESAVDSEDSAAVATTHLSGQALRAHRVVHRPGESRKTGAPHRQLPKTSQSDRSGPTIDRRSMVDTAESAALPARKVFPIQIGDKLFRLSGASISSDAPSYFSQFFEEQVRQNSGADNVRTLYVDRDPTTFEDISLHLQGYHIEPRNGAQFVKLFADAQFFSLPRLIAQLFASPIYIRVGDHEFQIPRELFSSPGDSPNYFSLGFSVFFTTPTNVFPGLQQRALLRPPPIFPPSVPNKGHEIFAEILHLLRGYPVRFRDELHRAEVLRDVRYFHLKGLEQRIIPHTISYNLAREISEIAIPLVHIRASGISFVPDSAASSPLDAPPATSSTSAAQGPGWIYYQRPYVDSEAHCLILEIGSEESSILSLTPTTSPASARVARVSFHRDTLSQMSKLLTLIGNKMNLPVTQPLGLMMMERGAGVASLPVSPGNSGLAEARVKVRIGPEAHVILDGQKWHGAQHDETEDEDPSSAAATSKPGIKRRRPVNDDDEDDEDEDEEVDWIVTRAQYRLRVQPESRGAQAGRTGMELVLGAVKIEAMSQERWRNEARGFLT
ncbi:hypothetical protein LTR62_008029 [Meristemomyces frigidus]|uniref:Potassium channel tetramerisation-type BTB domain-containing protein n=1 Tax=Meristemomyces frigidus TaxID=1508187 RepID=A0AAN7TPW3_9PEZI|nr:hypothetical protein LTR62_008029 [Meristemomyces frigidus]